jgi:hypothetical protein
LALVAPVVVLVAVIGLAVLGPTGSSDATASPTVGDIAAVPSRTARATLVPGARPTVIPFLPHMPFMADRPEHGTDGLMGRLPFHLPPDPVAPRVNRFTIDDVAVVPATWETTPPWVRRLGALGSDRTDPDHR